MEDNFEESLEGGQVLLPSASQHAVLHKQPPLPPTGNICFICVAIIAIVAVAIVIVMIKGTVLVFSGSFTVILPYTYTMHHCMQY